MEYPKMLYQGGEAAADSRIVNDAAEEKAATEAGFKPFKVPKPTAAQVAKAVEVQRAVEYPLMVYLDGNPDADARVVDDEDGELAAAAERYVRAGAKPVDAKAEAAAKAKADAEAAAKAAGK